MSTTTEIPRRYAFVEIFGHRSHWAEITEVELAGTKMLRVHDVDTDEVHNYGGAALFNVAEISRERLDAHIADVQRRKQATAEREARWAAEEKARRNARLLAVREPDPPDDPDQGDDPEEIIEPAPVPDPLEMPIMPRPRSADDREIPF